MSSQIEKKVHEKLTKLLNLARRGVGGEKDNARRMLDRMLERHGLTIDDLDEELREIRWFPVGNAYDRRLAAQILGKVCDSLDPGVYRSKRRPKQVGVEVTPAEAIEFELHYDVLRKALGEHFKDAFSAFVQANKLFSTKPSTDIEPAWSDRDFRVMTMASAIPQTPVNPRLELKQRGAKS